MTNIEAASRIQAILERTQMPDYICIDRQSLADREALNLAIEVLKAQSLVPAQMSGTSEDTISRQAAIECVTYDEEYTIECLKALPSTQLESCEYYALCRHSRDENKLRADLGVCNYCYEDSDGYVKPIEKNCHAFIRFGMNGWEISLSAKGWNGSAKIMYCPMCGRKLKNDK